MYIVAQSWWVTWTQPSSSLWCSRGVYSRDYARRSKFLSDSLLFLSFIKISICSISSSYSFFFFSTHALLTLWLFFLRTSAIEASFIALGLASVLSDFYPSLASGFLCCATLSVTMPSLCPEWHVAEVGTFLHVRILYNIYFSGNCFGSLPMSFLKLKSALACSKISICLFRISIRRAKRSGRLLP